MNEFTFTSLSSDDLQNLVKNCLSVSLKDLNPVDSNDDELLTIDEVQKLFKVSRVTIYNWRKKGLLPFYQIQSRIYFKRRELLESLNRFGSKYGKRCI